MNKSILVINTPKCCGKCDVRRYDGNDTWRCFKINRILDDIENISSDCPLKDLPQYLKIPYLFRQEQIANGLQNEDGSVPVYTEDYMNGWNACLDEILGGEE